MGSVRRLYLRLGRNRVREHALNWLREAISDEQGQADIAYISLLALMVAVGLVVLFICGMVAYDYFHCAKDCRFDPLPLGQSVGLICGAFFGTGLTGLAAYMLATRKPRDKAPDPLPDGKGQ